MDVNKDYLNILYSLLDKYREIFISLFSINDEVLDTFLLKYLWDYNYIVLMRDNSEDHIFLGTSYSYGGFDRYGYVKAGIARHPEQMFSTERKNFDDTNSVVIYANSNKQSMSAKLQYLITEMASIYFAEQNNLRLSMVKAMIKSSKQTATIMEQLFNTTFLNPKSVVMLKDNGEDIGLELEKIDLDIDYIASKYQQSIMFYHNQILERLGVNFTPFEKKERLVTNEVDSNNEVNTNIKSKYVKWIQYKLDKYNKIYDTDLEITTNEEQIDERSLNNENDIDEDSN